MGVNLGSVIVLILLVSFTGGSMIHSELQEGGDANIFTESFASWTKTQMYLVIQTSVCFESSWALLFAVEWALRLTPMFMLILS